MFFSKLSLDSVWGGGGPPISGNICDHVKTTAECCRMLVIFFPMTARGSCIPPQSPQEEILNRFFRIEKVSESSNPRVFLLGT
jgi:hypothetical protein